LNALFLGRRRKGKTTLSVFQALEQQKRTGRGIVVYDINSQVKIFPDQIVYSLDELQESVDKQEEVIVYRPMNASFLPSEKNEIETDFKSFVEVIWPKTGYILIVDEAHWLQGPGYCHNSLAGYVRMSDPFGIDLFQTAHAPADMWSRTKSLASDWYVFHLTREADLEAVESQCGEAMREAVSHLGPHDYAHYNMDTEQFEIVNDPASWFVDINKRGELIHA